VCSADYTARGASGINLINLINHRTTAQRHWSIQSPHVNSNQSNQLTSSNMARKLPSRVMRWGINLWPPYLGAGIRVRRITRDYREVVVEMPLKLRNRNYFGTHFGVGQSRLD
jgi:hypothetical protein